MPIVCKASEIKPGDIIAVELDGVFVAVANAGGRFFAVTDVCPHGGCSLSQGDLWQTVINCPCHGGQFDLETGEVVGGPSLEPLQCFQIEVVGDELRIG